MSLLCWSNDSVITTPNLLHVVFSLFQVCHQKLLYPKVYQNHRRVEKYQSILWACFPGSPGGTSGKELTCQCRRHKRKVPSLGQEDPLEKEMAIQSSTIAWKIPWTEELGRLQSMGSQRVGHDWATSLTHRLVTTFLPRSKLLLISWLQSPSAVDFGAPPHPRKESATVAIVSPSICHEVMGQDAMILVFWMLSFKTTFSLSSFTFIKRAL